MFTRIAPTFAVAYCVITHSKLFVAQIATRSPRCDPQRHQRARRRVHQPPRAVRIREPRHPGETLTSASRLGHASAGDPVQALPDRLAQQRLVFPGQWA
jgi:hypothetical protein